MHTSARSSLDSPLLDEVVGLSASATASRARAMPLRGWPVAARARPATRRDQISVARSPAIHTTRASSASAAAASGSPRPMAVSASRARKYARHIRRGSRQAYSYAGRKISSARCQSPASASTDPRKPAADVLRPTSSPRSTSPERALQRPPERHRRRPATLGGRRGDSRDTHASAGDPDAETCSPRTGARHRDGRGAVQRQRDRQDIGDAVDACETVASFSTLECGWRCRPGIPRRRARWRT